MIWLLCLSVLSVVATAGRVCSPDIVTDQLNRFDFPAPRCLPNNYTGVNTYPVGTQLTIKWATTQPRISLILWQAGNSAAGTGTLLFNVTSADHTSYEFTGYPPQPLSDGNTFFFAVYVPGQTSQLFSSDYFNLTETSLNSTTTTSSSSSTSTSTPSSSPSTSSPGSAPQISEGKYIAIGIAIGIGSTLLITALVIFLLRRRSKAAQKHVPPTLNESHHTGPYDDKYPAQTGSHYTYDNHSHGHSQFIPPREMEHPHDRYAMLSDVSSSRRTELQAEGRSIVELPGRSG